MKKEIWNFSVVDIVGVLIEQKNFQTARKYWNKLKERLKKEGSESVTNCHQLKLEVADGKGYIQQKMAELASFEYKHIQRFEGQKESLVILNFSLSKKSLKRLGFSFRNYWILNSPSHLFQRERD